MNSNMRKMYTEQQIEEMINKSIAQKIENGELESNRQHYKIEIDKENFLIKIIALDGYVINTLEIGDDNGDSVLFLYGDTTNLEFTYKYQGDATFSLDEFGSDYIQFAGNSVDHVTHASIRNITLIKGYEMSINE